MKCLPNIDEKQNKVLNAISEVSEELDVKAFVVGGFVRDYYLGIPNDDIDVVVEGSGIEFAKYMANKYSKGKFQYYESYGTAMVNIFGLEVEFVGARKEMYERGSRKPIVEEGTLKDDQQRRDFTINAMAFSMCKDSFGELVDPFNGMKDLKEGRIKSVNEPDITFSEDPLRMFRAVRFYAKLKKTMDNVFIDEETFNGIKKNLYRTKILSQERITEELNKIFSYTTSSYGIEKLYESGLGEHLTSKDKDYLSWPMELGITKYLREIDKCQVNDGKDYSKLKWFCFSYLVPTTEKDVHKKYNDFCLEFRLPLEYGKYMSNIDICRQIIAVNGKIGQLRKVPYILGEDYTDVFVGLKAFNIKGSLDFTEYFKIVREQTDIFSKEFIGWKCPINGNSISNFMGIPLSEGKEIGRLKKIVEEGILNGEVENSRKGAEELLRNEKIKMFFEKMYLK